MRPYVTLLAVALALWFGACGGEPTPAEHARAIEGQVWSPYCPGRLLADCSTRQSDELRDRIESRLRAGEEPEAVLAWLQDNYGPQVLARPSGDARGVTAWLVPASVLVAAGLVVGGLLLRWSRPATPTPGDAPVGPPEERWIRRVRAEVDEDP